MDSIVIYTVRVYVEVLTIRAVQEMEKTFEEKLEEEPRSF